MWLSSLLLLFAFSSVFGTIDEIGNIEEQCRRKTRDYGEETFGEGINDVKMEVFCSLNLHYFNCVDNSLLNLGTTLEGIVAENNKEDLVQLKIMINMKSLAMDACTEGTQLNKDLKANWQCLEITMMENPTDSCQSEAREALEVFTEVANEIEEEEGDVYHYIKCMNMAYTAACVASKVHEKCGLQAFNTINTVVKRSAILPTAFCSKKELEMLKTSFVDNLEMTEINKNLFRLTLDLKR